MQTFLPFPSYAESAHCLDRRRLGKQRVECKQIVLVLEGRTEAWQHHPAVRMWRGHLLGLCQYGWHCCEEWRSRGYRDSLALFFALRFPKRIPSRYDLPDWFGRRDFHRSHQSNLVRKDPRHYRAWFPCVPDNLPYLWPVPVTN